MKRLLFTLAVIIVLVGIGVAVYFFFFSSSAPHLTVGTPGSFNTSTSTRSTDASQISAGTIVAPGFVKIASNPVAAGEVAFDINTTPAPSLNASSSASTTPTAKPDVEVHYIDRESGNIYAYTVFAHSITRISNKTLPGIQESSWKPDGSLAFARFLSNTNGSESLDTYALPSNGEGGYFLQSNLDQVTVTGSSTLFTLSASADGSVGTTAKTDGTNSHTLFSSPLASLIVYPAGNAFMAADRAANTLGGYLFAINSAGTFTPLLGPYRGLTVLPSPSGKLVLYSYTDGSTFHLYVLDTVQGTTTALPLATIADKCTWISNSSAVYCGVPDSMTGTLPDDWYQGATSFNDKIWKIDLGSRLATLIVSPLDTAHVSIDAVNLTVDPNNQVLVFRNKKDSSLWAYSL